MVSIDSLLLLGRSNWRDDRRLIGVTQASRLHHLYVIGQTGTGKSTLLENLMRQDLESRRGFAFLDPHADTIGRIASSVPDGRSSEVLYLNVPDPDCEFGFNPLDTVPPDQRPLAASGIIESFKNVWGQWWGPRLEHLFRNALLTLLDQPSATLADLTRLFGDDKYRKEAIARVTHPAVRDFWAREFAHYPVRYRAEALAPLLNKLGAFLSQPPLYRILTKEKSSFDLREVMDSGKVLLVNLAKGRMGADACSLLGALLVSRIGLAGLARADVPEASRQPFFVYLDEFQNFTTLSVATMLSELRKYKVGLILAHQYVAQVETEVRDAIMGNVGNMVVFRVGPPDAKYLNQYFSPEFEDLDLMNLPNYNFFIRVMLAGQLSRPFSGETLPPEGGGGRGIP